MDNYQDYTVEDFIGDDYFVDWVLRPQAGHEEFWQAWIVSNPAKANDVAKARRIILSIRINELPQQLSIADMQQMDSRMQGEEADDEPQPAKSKVKLLFLMKVAAMLLTVCLLGLLFYNRFKASNAAIGQYEAGDYTRVRNSAKESKVVLFPDGSLAVLKPNSVLTYPKIFKGAKREVTLDGEAFFEVRKNKAHPFYVYAQDMVTRVVGTSFTVTAFAGQKTFKVVVTTGKVMVYNAKSPQQSVVKLVPNQKTVFSKTQLRLTPDTVKTPLKLSNEIAQQNLTFNNTPLPVVIKELEEAYQVHVIYDESRFGKLTVTASLAMLPLDEKIRLIAKAINADAEFSNGQIILKK